MIFFLEKKDVSNWGCFGGEGMYIYCFSLPALPSCGACLGFGGCRRMRGTIAEGLMCQLYCSRMHRLPRIAARSPIVP